MPRIDLIRFLALTAAIAGCSGSQRPESEPRREVATVSVPEPGPEDDASDASVAPTPDAAAAAAAASEAPDPGDESAQARIGDSDAGVLGLLRMADGGGVTGFGHFGGLGGLSGATGLGNRSHSRVSQGSVKIQGGLDKDIIRRIVRRSVIRIRYCYERELAKDPKLTAKAVPKFTIAPDGSVTSATLSQSTGNASLDACILTVFRALSFPTFDGGVVVVSYPLILTPTP